MICLIHWGQQFSIWVSLPPGDIWQYLQTSLESHLGNWVLLASAGRRPGCCKYPVRYKTAPRNSHPSPHVNGTETEKSWFRASLFSVSKPNTLLESGSSAASILRQVPPLKLLWCPPSSPALTNSCFKIVTCKVYLRHTESRNSELRFKNSRLALCC